MESNSCLCFSSSKLCVTCVYEIWKLRWRVNVVLHKYNNNNNMMSFSSKQQKPRRERSGMNSHRDDKKVIALKTERCTHATIHFPKYFWQTQSFLFLCLFLSPPKFLKIIYLYQYNMNWKIIHNKSKYLD